MLKSFAQPLYEAEIIKEIRNEQTDGRVISITGCVDSARLHLASAIGEGRNVNVIVTYDDLRAREIYDEYRFYDRDVVLYPAKDLIFFQADIHGNQLARDRIRTYRKCLEGGKTTIVTTFAALLSPIPDASSDSDTVSLSKGDTCDQTALALKLAALGYERMPQTESPGQFSIRGDIIDIYDLTEDNPYRIELWGDDIDSIRNFDPFSQRSIEELPEITIYPAAEYILSKDDIEKGIKRIEAESKTVSEKFRKALKTQEAYRLSNLASELREKLEMLGGRTNIESYASYFYPEGLISFPEWIKRVSGGDICWFIDEPLRVKQQSDAVTAEFSESFTARLEKGYALPGQADRIYAGETIAAKMNGMKIVTLRQLPGDEGFFAADKKIDIDSRNTSPYNGSFETLIRDLKDYRNKKYKVVMLTSSRTRGARMAEDLRDRDIPAAFSDDPEREVIEGETLITYGRIGRGFEYPALKFVVLTENDIFGGRSKKTRKKKFAAGSRISSLDDLHPGDYIVHELYGLGIYKGIEKIESGHAVRDYIRLEYRDGGVLYALATELDAVQKYASSDAEGVPRINKLGGKEWEKTKTKARAAAAEIAKDLVELYARRRSIEGHSFGADTVWQKEFEELFPYEATQDQEKAIAETKADMESSRIMDRLICGDVGFGKTEVALRAAFKAVQDGKQVAYLVPTTILAQQHYNTFKERFEKFPVRVELLSRFRTPREIKKVIEDLGKGLVDVVIGTHRLLSADVKFKDLGLLVIDEEQRFGVTHKEKIKKLRENVDVLTLSATPIPRTLHMSLVGIRDMSLLEEAPEERIPIQTFVCEYDEELVREAITRELARGGQVYYLFNRVAQIAEMTTRIQSMIPNARVAFAHGQMAERELENIMYDFVEGNIDVLVCTTIIETGMDIPNVNTLIIHDSDRMGLSQLYQLRGRVGRSNRNSYAFLMYKRDKILTEVAEKRLGAIREFTDLGSGFKIAMRDLEIRGAGNLLGRSQHGHMEAVGYDLYCKMLGEEIAKNKGETVREKVSAVVGLDVDAYLPAEYVVNEEQKLDLYKRIAAITGEEDRNEMEDELKDRFGKIPHPAENLLRIAMIRCLAQRIDLTEVKGGDGQLQFIFRPDASIDPAGIPAVIKKCGRHLEFDARGKSPKFIYSYTPESLAEKAEMQVLEITEDLIAKMQDLAPEAP